MRATVMYRAGDVRVENVPDATIKNPTDALVRITRACICGSDLWPYHDLPPTENGRRMGHEAIGVVEAIGADVRKVKKGDFVVMPFAYSDGTCDFCHEGLQTACVQGWFFGSTEEVGGAQAEAIRIPLADGTLYSLTVGEDHALLASLLTLSDVMGTGHHAAVVAKVSRGKNAAVVGDGAVGLCGVIAAKRLGAEQIIILGRHSARLELAKMFGATDIVSERGEEAVEYVRQLTSGLCPFSPGVRWKWRGDGHLRPDYAGRWSCRSRWCSSLRSNSRRGSDFLQEHYNRRRSRSRSRLH
jgi:threonine dehydrogenase-like Zn-dependent dehydrogenase